MELKYKSINNLKWEEILRKNCRTWQVPITAQLPIQPKYSKDLVLVGSALNVRMQRLFPDISPEDVERRENRRNNEVMTVQFAFDDPPFVPDCRLTITKLTEGRYPILEASYFAWDIHYQFEYFCQPLDERQNLIWVRVTIINEDSYLRNRVVNVRTKVSFLPFKDVFFSFYTPFHLIAKNYLPSPHTGLDGEKITFKGKQIGRILPGGFNFEWESKRNFKEEDYNNKEYGNSDYYVMPDMKYKEVEQAILCSGELKPKQSLTFSIALFSDYKKIKDSHIQTIESIDPEVSKRASIRYFKEKEEKETASIEFSHNRWQDILFRMETSIKQMLIRPLGKDYLIPMQGGFSHNVWVWEAMVMLLPMLKLGHFSIVKDVLTFVFSLQDSGYAPSGRLTTTKGAIGTTGPRWLCTTGSALALAADYYLYSRDEEFLKEYLPKMLKAVDWIIGEIRATRKLNEDGSRPAYYGLMPFGTGTDGDIGYIVAATDSFTYWGLKKFSDMMCVLNHSRAEEIKKETEAYKNDISQTVKTLTSPDGFIERKISISDQKIYSKFDFVCGAQQLFFVEAVNGEQGLLNFIKYYEDNIAYGPFMGKLDRDKVYIGNSEYYWQDIYFRLGEWKKAFLALQTYMKYGMTEETFLIQERFSLSNPTFIPWQPNGSGCGRLIDMMLKSFYFEHNQEAVLLGGIPFAWLRDNGKTSLNGLFVPGGRISLKASIQTEDKCLLLLSADKISAMPHKVRIPNFFVVESVSSGVKREKDSFILPEGIISLELLLRDANI